MKKNSGYKNINSSGMKKGGCNCGCQAMTKSNHPDPFKKTNPKPLLVKQKNKTVKIKKDPKQKINPY